MSYLTVRQSFPAFRSCLFPLGRTFKEGRCHVSNIHGYGATFEIGRRERESGERWNLPVMIEKGGE